MGHWVDLPTVISVDRPSIEEMSIFIPDSAAIALTPVNVGQCDAKHLKILQGVFDLGVKTRLEIGGLDTVYYSTFSIKQLQEHLGEP